MKNKQYDLIVVGGGAAGFFTAIQLAERHKGARILILEKGKRVLDKVRVSGGGRCNVTHACFDPAELIEFYPRGRKELRGPFSQFMCGDMMAWLDEHGVETKIESDGRVFPVSNSSQTIIDCFTKLVNKYKIELKTSEGLESFSREGDHWRVSTKLSNYSATHLMMCTGSAPSVWKLLKHKDINIIPPVPSLFTFNIDDELLMGLMGLSMPNAAVKINDTKHKASGPLLITHWGLSGPAVLKLSAWAARELNAKSYKFNITVNWLDINQSDLIEEIKALKIDSGSAGLYTRGYFGFPKRLWHSFLRKAEIGEKNWSDLSNKELNRLAQLVTCSDLIVDGKSTFKDEFVTSGGVDLREIDFKTMQHKAHKNLYFAGEVLNIDAVTGGFNFQAAWTGGWVAAQGMSLLS